MACCREQEIPPILPTTQIHSNHNFSRRPQLRRRHEHHGWIHPKPENSILKLNLISQYTGFELETTKCEATGARWALGNPLAHKNQATLKEQIHTVTFFDGSRIRYLPPCKPYKMLGVHINTILDFRENLTHINKDVRKLAKALAKQKLSPSLKTLVTEQLLKSKYHAQTSESSTTDNSPR